MTAISLDRGWFGYNATAVLRDIHLTIENGERVAFVGESGAGKSTLLKLAYDGVRARAALVPQDLGLVEGLSVFHNIYMGRLDANPLWRNVRNLALPRKADVADVEAVLSTLELEDKLFARVADLSGGQRQRTAIGRALYRASAILIADEPVSAVDPHQARRLLDALTQTHATCLIAMHDVDHALAVATRIVGLKAGRIAFDAPTHGLTREDLDHLYDA